MRPSLPLLLVLLGSLGLWHAADALQARLALGLGWALLDVLGHAAVALAIMLWTWPAWGWRPTLVAVLAATLIDLDHVVAAGSLDPARLTSLAARPPAHSLLGTLVLANLGAAFGGPRLGYAAGVGALSHIVRDATAPPGVPLLVPLVDDWHLLLPDWSLLGLVVALAAASVLLASWSRRPRFGGSWPWRRSPRSALAPRSRAVPAPDRPG